MFTSNSQEAFLLGCRLHWLCVNCICVLVHWTNNYEPLFIWETILTHMQFRLNEANKKKIPVPELFACKWQFHLHNVCTLMYPPVETSTLLSGEKCRSVTHPPWKESIESLVSREQIFRRAPSSMLHSLKRHKTIKHWCYTKEMIKIHITLHNINVDPQSVYL